MNSKQKIINLNPITENAKQYLMRYRDQRKQLDLEKMRLEDMKESCSISAQVFSTERIMSSRRHDANEKRIAELADATAELDKRINEVEEMGYLLREEIWNVCNGYHAKILALYFCNGENFSNITKTIGYSKRHIFTLYNEALEIFTDYLNKKREQIA